MNDMSDMYKVITGDMTCDEKYRTTQYVIMLVDCRPQKAASFHLRMGHWNSVFPLGKDVGVHASFAGYTRLLVDV